jgi:hypothetical protein
MTAPNGNDNKPTPPYLPFKTLTGFLDDLKSSVVPNRIDNSMMSKLSGSMRTQMRGALLFLGLIDDTGMVQSKLRLLVKARGTEEWKNFWSDVFFMAYADVTKNLDLEVGTLQELKDAFRAYGVDGSVLIKAVRFWLSGIENTGSTYSPHFRARGLSLGVRSAPRQRQRNATPPVAQAPGSQTKTPARDVPADDPEGTQRFTLPLKDRPNAVMVVPKDMTAAEWGMLDVYIRMYFNFTAKANSGPGA